MLNTKDWFNKFLKEHPTFPPHHNYTGWGHKGAMELKPVSWLDEISMTHDKEVRSSTIIGTFKNSAEQSWGNIKADSKFISRYLLGYLTLFVYPIYITYKLSFGLKSERWKFVAWNIPLDLLVGAVGIVLFITNILLNGINLGIIIWPKIYSWVKSKIK